MTRHELFDIPGAAPCGSCAPTSAPETMGECLLEMRGIGRRFAGGAGVTGVDLQVHRGEVVGICGASGYGKSTLLRLIAEREQATEGTLARQFQRLAMVFQEPQLLPWLTARENVALVLKERAGEQALNALHAVGLEQAAEQYPAQLSGGMRQRVGIARALAANPDLLLMDEPFSNLDYFTRMELLELVRHRVLEREVAVIFVSHDVREVVRLCDRVMVMGGKPGHLLARLANPLPRGERDQRPGALAQFEQRILEAIQTGRANAASGT